MQKQANKNDQKLLDFDSVRIKIASPEDISKLSHGEVIKPETINYRTQKPERDGLFCERIFGPTKDWECYCGKYKKIRYKGVVCDRCGVEVTRSSVRRERMGHIDLACPVSHIWYLRGVPSLLGLVLDMSVSDLEKVIYFAAFITLEVNEQIKKEALEQLELEYKVMKEKPQSVDIAVIDSAYKQTKEELTGLKIGKVITEAKYHDLSLKYGQIVRVGIGAEAVTELLKTINLDEEIKNLHEQSINMPWGQKRKVLKRVRLLMDMKKAGIEPLWLVLSKLPVIPPDLRPMVQLDGGRFAASDLNDLYRRVINRNNRLKKLINQGAPEVICRNEKRMLQEAVDALIDNSSRRTKPVTTGAGRPLRSLSDLLRGKQGRFRQNLLGKRVDYSARSVIVVGPNLELHEAGIPKSIALELFKPFVISKLLSEGFVHNVKNASKLVERGTPEVWDILEQVIENAHVMLNRAPTLHRLGIQAFKPVLIEGKAIQVHPLVCAAFNADFDGDQMAIHLPLSKQARTEAAEIMKSSHNILKPASGEPIVTPRLDMVLGCYWLTSIQNQAKGEGKIFSSKNEAILAFQKNVVHPRAKIFVRLSKKPIDDTPEEIVETSVGRIIFNNIIPKGLRYLNEVMDLKQLKKLVKKCFDLYGAEETAKLVDKIKKTGFQYATYSGMTISIDDITIPNDKANLVKKGDLELEEIENQYRRGLITEDEKALKTRELWMRVKDEIEKHMIEEFPKDSPVFIAVTSGARGTMSQLVQMAGMKGLTVNPAGEIIEVPLKSNFKEGLTALEYFISTHGSRKGKSDTALRTSDAGYLTRRLIDVAQDSIISENDCGTTEGLLVTREKCLEIGLQFEDRLSGRVSLENIIDPETKKILVKKDQKISQEDALIVSKSKAEKALVRSVMYCNSTWGICQKCYGRDLSTGKLVNMGEAVGVVAAQAIGEPGTQLTLKTFHMGGVSGDDITSGLPRVEELFEARTPRRPALLAEFDGRVEITKEKDQVLIKLNSPEIQSETYSFASDYAPSVEDGDIVKAHQAVAISTGKKAIRSKISGTVKIDGNNIIVSSKEKISREYITSPRVTLKIDNGSEVKKGQELTEGHLDLDQALKLKGKEAIKDYIIKEILDIYTSQGQTINEKHAELIVRKMFSKVYIHDGGDSNYFTGQIVEFLKVKRANEKLQKEKKKPIIFEEIVMGITRVALKTGSFLSAASFQETTNILMEAAIRGAEDKLQGLKENVIIGRLIPAGTGFKGKPKIDDSY